MFDITEARSALRTGENLLAIHGMNAQIDSLDFLVMPELVGLTVPLLATITTPADTSISIPAGTGIRFESKPSTDTVIPIIGSIATHWQITEAEAFGKPIATITPDGNFEVFFPHPGSYRIRLTARDEAGAETFEERVIRVGEFKAYDKVADAIRVGMDQSLSDYQTTLNVTAVPAVPGPTPPLNWQVVSGPGIVTFKDPSAESTEVAFSQSGQYQIRCLSSRPDLTLFDDVIVNVLTEQRTLIGESSTSTYHYFSELSYQPNWNRPDFSDAQWRPGKQGLGYDLTENFDPYIDTDVQSTMQHVHSSIYVRYPFILDNVRSIHRLELTLRSDDGCVVYINGHEVHRQHAPLYDLGPGATAVRTADETLLGAPQSINLTEFRSRLQPGYNVLAIHGLNQSITSSDFLVQPTLTASLGRADRPPDGLNSPDLIAYALEGTLPEVELLGDEMLVSYVNTADLKNSGGRVDVETSADLSAWRRWPFVSRSIKGADDGFNEQVVLAGPRELEMQFVRLRVSF